MNKRFTSTISGASIFLAGVAVLGRGIGFIREIIFASYFGLSEDFDIYLVGAVLPLTLDVIIFYIGQNYFIPSFNNYANNSSSQRQDFLRFNFWIFTLIGAFVSVILYIFSYQIVNLYLGDLSGTTINKTVDIFRIFLITIPFSASISILTAYLQSKFNFTTPGFSRLFLNASIILMIILFTDSLSIYVIPIGHVLGTVVQFVFLLKKSELNLFGKFISNGAFGYFLKSTFLITILIESISQLYIISDRYFMSSVDQGGVAALNYAQTLFLLPISIVSLAISTALLSKLSQSFVKGSFDELRLAFNDGVRINLFVFVPLTFVFYFYGIDIIRLLYQRGNFNEADSLLTFNTLKYLVLSFIFYSVYSISNKLFYSANLVKPLLFITIIGIIIKIIFNFLLVDLMKQNGLALSTSLSYLFFFGGSLIILKKKNIITENIFIRELLFHFISAVISLIVVKLFFISTNFNNGYLEIIFFLIIIYINNLMLNSRSYFLVSMMFNRLFNKV